MNLSPAWCHVRLVRELDQGEPSCSRSLTQAVVTSVFLALVGFAMVIYLVSVRSSGNPHSEDRKGDSHDSASNHRHH